VEPVATPSGVPATSALADVSARLDALEGQLRTLTGQAEENAHRLALMEKALADFRAATETRLTAVETPASAEEAVPAASAATGKGAALAKGPASASNPGGDPAEAAYLKGYDLWRGGKYAEAETVLEAMVKKYPKHPRASFAQNLLGRAYLDDGKPATAAKVFLDNYDNNRNGERAPDSLFYLGQALVELKEPANACKVYDELESVYGAKLRTALKDELPKARAAAKCR
jgi:TolA-binding protein